MRLVFLNPTDLDVEPTALGNPATGVDDFLGNPDHLLRARKKHHDGARSFCFDVAVQFHKAFTEHQRGSIKYSQAWVSITSAIWAKLIPPSFMPEIERRDLLFGDPSPLRKPKNLTTDGGIVISRPS